MYSNSDSGHGKNVFNYEQLITSVNSMGADYNPTNPNLKIASLANQLSIAKFTVDNLETRISAYKNAVSLRDKDFEVLSSIITRTKNALIAAGAITQQIEQTMTLVRKIQGRRATPFTSEEEKNASAANGKTINEISASQMSYSSRLENFHKLIKLLSNIPNYNPNESDLKIASLTSLYNKLNGTNSLAATTEILLFNARSERNKILYDENSGLVATAIEVKTYVKSVFGSRSSQYKLIGQIPFRTYKS